MRELGCWFLLIAVGAFLIVLAFLWNSRTIFIIG